MNNRKLKQLFKKDDISKKIKHLLNQDKSKPTININKTVNINKKN